MEITPMVSMAAESTDTERAQTIASQLVHCAQHASAVEWICAGSSECARSNSTHTSKGMLRSRRKLSGALSGHGRSHGSPVPSESRAIGFKNWCLGLFHFVCQHQYSSKICAQRGVHDRAASATRSAME